ncbi:MAG: hypothetical protein ACRC41_17970, partial [Sarcina sp.]
MYSVSSEFISAIKEASREFKSKVLIGGDEYSDEKIINFILEKSMAPSDEFSLGAVVASKFELTIALADIRNNKIIKPYLALKVGKDFEDVPLGVFNIEEKSIQNGVVNIKCFDNIGKFEKPYFSDLSYPTTVQRVANEICSKAGVTLATTLPTLNIDKKIDGYTCREALSFIASACGGFAIANRTGEIEIKSVGGSTSSITGDNYFTFENDDTFTIKKVTAHVDENTVISRGEGIGIEEIEFKNPIANNQIMDHIYSKLKNYTYAPASLVWQGNPALDVGEKMSVTDISGTKREMLVMRDKITYSGGLRGETNSVAKSLGKSNFNYGGSMQGAVDRVTAEQIVVKELLADKADISQLNAINANIENLTVSKADIEQLQATNANIENLKANKANITDLNATNAVIQNLQATKADIVDLNATNATIGILEAEVGKIGVLEGDVANIQDIVNGNLSSENIQTGGITGDRLNMNTIFVNDGNIVNVNASKVNAGEIDTSKVKVKSADGGVEIVGATQQFRDKNNKVRIQMGKDTKGDFNFIIKGEDGTTTLIDHTGVKENAIADDLIQDNMIAPDAVGEKQIDYNSFSTGFNKDTNTSQIKGTKVRLDNQNQSLEVAFTSLKSKADGTQTQTESNTTQINVQQGQISTAIANTKIVKDGEEVLLKDDYNTTVATVDSMKNTISSHTTKIDSNTGKITGVESKTNVLERDLNSMSSKLSSTEATVNTHTTQINTVTGTANSAIDKANKAQSDATKNKNDIVTVNTEVTNTKNKVSGIEQDLNSITQRVGSVESTTTSHTATINNHTSSLNAVDGKINTAKNAAVVDARKLLDTRSTNENPSWYFTNYPRQTITEFKHSDVVGIAGSRVYGTLETKVPWSDSSGGYPVQMFRSNNKQTFERKGLSNTGWSAWAQVEDVAGAQNKANQALNDSKGYTNTEINKVVTNTNSKFAEIKTTTDSITQTVSNTNKEVETVKVNLTNKTSINEQTKINGQELLPQGYKVNIGDGFDCANNSKALFNNNKITIKGNLWIKTVPTLIKFDRTKPLYWKVNAITTGAQFYVGIERYDKNKNVINNAANGACVYFVSGSTTLNGAVEGWWNETDKATAYIQLRILCDWNNTGKDTIINEISWKQLSASSQLDTSKEILDITTEKVNQAKADIKVTTDAISSKVSQVESTTNTINGKVNSHESRLISAEQKITPNAIINTVQSTVNQAKNEAINSANSSTDGKLNNFTSKQEFTEFKQTSQNIQAKIVSTSGINFISNPVFNTGNIQNWSLWGNPSWSIKEDVSLGFNYSLKLQCNKSNG